MLTALLLLACSDYELVEDKDQPPVEEEELVPSIQVSPSSLDFGEVSLGGRQSLVLTVQNVGTGDLTLQEVTLDDAEGPFSFTGPEATLLPPEAQTEIVVAFDAQLYGDNGGTLRVLSDDPFNPEVPVPLTARALGPDIELEPTSVDFGTIEVGESGVAELRVRNVGSADLHILSWALNQPEFTVLDDGGLDGATLSMGQQVTVTVAYTPVDEGPDEATFIVRSDDLDEFESASTLVGSGIITSITHDVRVGITADDAHRVWLDGVEITGPNASGWSAIDDLHTTLETGDHVLAVWATDQAQVIAGLIVVVWIDGVPTYLTGSSAWTLSASNPGTGWELVGFDDSAWSPGTACTDTSPWGGNPLTLLNEGAQWIWRSGNCRALGEAWFRLEMSLP